MSKMKVGSLDNHGFFDDAELNSIKARDLEPQDLQHACRVVLGSARDLPDALLLLGSLGLIETARKMRNVST